MTKKDYELIASGLKKELDDHMSTVRYFEELGDLRLASDYGQQRQGVVHAIYAVMRTLQSQDPSFKRRQFLSDCGIKD